VRVGNMVYISERITNLHEYERSIAMCRTFYNMAVSATNLEDKQNALQSLNDELLKLENYDFCIERRKVVYCE